MFVHIYSTDIENSYLHCDRPPLKAYSLENFEFCSKLLLCWNTTKLIISSNISINHPLCLYSYIFVQTDQYK